MIRILVFYILLCAIDLAHCLQMGKTGGTFSAMGTQVSIARASINRGRLGKPGKPWQDHLWTPLERKKELNRRDTFIEFIKIRDNREKLKQQATMENLRLTKTAGQSLKNLKAAFSKDAKEVRRALITCYDALPDLMKNRIQEFISFLKFIESSSNWPALTAFLQKKIQNFSGDFESGAPALAWYNNAATKESDKKKIREFITQALAKKEQQTSIARLIKPLR